MQGRILRYIQKNQMIEKNDLIIIGVSGGADSVCLFHILNGLKEMLSVELAVVHVNHDLRGEDAKADEQFVKQLCARDNIRYQSMVIDVKAEAKKRAMTIEEAGRVVRREELERLAEEWDANKIALGHHQDDQAETVLFNLVRGSVVSGLCGIHPARGKYIRPLLCVSKAEIEDYLANNNFAWRVDESNLMEDYTRNKIRHQVLKYLKDKVNQKTGKHIANTAEYLQEVEAYLIRQSEHSYSKHAKAEGVGIFIDEELMTEEMIIQKYVMRHAVKELVDSLKDLTKNHLEQMLAIFDKAVGKKVDIIKGLEIKRTYKGVLIREKKLPSVKKPLVEAVLPVPGRCKIGDKMFRCNVETTENPIIEGKTYTKSLDYDKINEDLIIRTRRQGDVIVTCAEGGKKKLKDYFIDAKIPRDQRDEMLLLTVGSEVLWIVGNRTSEKYRVTKATKQILVISQEGKE